MLTRTRNRIFVLRTLHFFFFFFSFFFKFTSGDYRVMHVRERSPRIGWASFIQKSDARFSSRATYCNSYYVQALDVQLSTSDTRVFTFDEIIEKVIIGRWKWFVSRSSVHTFLLTCCSTWFSFAQLDAITVSHLISRSRHVRLMMKRD